METKRLRRTNRMANIELLRIVAMLMVIMLHYLGKGEFCPTISPYMDLQGYVAWTLKILSIVAVNLYVLISGYFLVENNFKVSKVFRLIIQTLFYSLFGTILCHILGIIDISEINFPFEWVTILFPVQCNNWWFVSTYILFYAFSPILAAGVKVLTKKQLQAVIGVILFFLCIEKSMLPIVTKLSSNGYSIEWFLCLFLVAAYIRLYGIEWLKKPVYSLVLYFGGVTLAFIEELLLFVFNEKTGWVSHLIGVTYSNYNHITVFMASVGLFCFFLYNVKVKEGTISKIICAIAPYTLGVYLLHEHLYIRYEWVKWFSVDEQQNVLIFILFAVVAVISVFSVGIIVDYLRNKLFVWCGRILSKLWIRNKV